MDDVTTKTSATDGTKPLCVMIVAAEASGDRLGADLMASIGQRTDQPVRFVGVGGKRMQAAGITSPFDISALSIVGLFDGLALYPRVLKWADQTARMAVEERADVAVLIDSWGFTIRVAERIRRLAPDLPIVKYVGPQVWAHRPGRAKRLALVADLLLSTQLRDAPEYDGTDLAVTFVGDPALRRDYSRADPQRFRDRFAIPPDAPILLLLPGSRGSEIRRLWQDFADAAAQLSREIPGLHVAVLSAESVAEDVRASVQAAPTPMHLVEAADDKADAMLAGTAALACSGTVTTELALAGQPMAVAYRLGALSHAVLDRLYRLDHICLLNITADEAIVQEFVQNESSGTALAGAIRPFLTDPDARARQVEAQNRALEMMGRSDTDPSDLAADAILDLVSARGRKG